MNSFLAQLEANNESAGHGIGSFNSASEPLHRDNIYWGVLMARIRPALVPVLLFPIVLAISACSPDPTITAPPQYVNLYVNSCSWCHDAGNGGAPKIGDKEDWERRTSKGMAKVYANAIDGYEGATGIMPEKGSRMDLSDDDIKKLVDFMVEASQ